MPARSISSSVVKLTVLVRYSTVGTGVSVIVGMDVGVGGSGVDVAVAVTDT